MAVTKNTYGRFSTLEGTLAEVATALDTYGVPAHKVISVFWDGSNYVAVYHK
jgi:hypothetical protein